MADTRSGSRPTIFVVDDDDSVRRGLSRLLRSLEFDVETCESANEFLERGNYEDVGCLILDVRMPGLSGMDLHDTLIGAGIDLPIVFITGHGDVPLSVQAMKKGAVDFLPKPFDENELLNALSKAIGQHNETKAERAEKSANLQRVERSTTRNIDAAGIFVTNALAKEYHGK